MEPITRTMAVRFMNLADSHCEAKENSHPSHFHQEFRTQNTIVCPTKDEQSRNGASALG